MTEPAPIDDPTEPESEVENESMTDNVSQISDAAAQKSKSDADVSGTGSANMGLIMDIPVTVSMELGRTRISIRELLSLNPGAVIELKRLASDPMEILVNGTLVAHGEAVRVGERYGVRLTSVVSAADRLKQVGG